MFKKNLGLIFNIIAIGLFIPGIMLPMFSLHMEISAQVAMSQLSTDIINKQLSLIGTIEELWQDNRLLVAILIALFSIVIPILKTTLLCVAYFIKQQVVAKKLVSFINIIGKWSMADIFVVAIFLAILSTNHGDTLSQQELILFGFKLNIGLSSSTLSQVGEGFYYFLSYCLLSIVGTQLTSSALKSKTQDK